MNAIFEDFETTWFESGDRLDRIAREGPQTFEAVHAILTDPIYTVPNGRFIGGGRAFGDALHDAGWHRVRTMSPDWFVMRHPATPGEELCFHEGIVTCNRTGK